MFLGCVFSHSWDARLRVRYLFSSSSSYLSLFAVFVLIVSILFLISNRESIDTEFSGSTGTVILVNANRLVCAWAGRDMQLLDLLLPSNLAALFITSFQFLWELHPSSCFSSSSTCTILLLSRHMAGDSRAVLFKSDVKTMPPVDLSRFTCLLCIVCISASLF